MLVLAGPGSGKTAVITGRTVRLIEKGISPSSILVVTFTRAAAREMKERFLAACRERCGELSSSGGSVGKKASENAFDRQEWQQVTFGTFHGIFYWILKNTYRISGSNIISEPQKKKLVQEILTRVFPDGLQEEDLPSAVCREISQVKGSETDIGNFYSAVLPQDVFRRVFGLYEGWKRENGRMDFDDIITRCYDLFRSRPDVLKRWQQKFRYILIDEFQDISPLQYKVMRMLAEPENNLFIVGDDDQSIYRFRGANPGIMLHFPQDYENAEIVALDQNYRSTQEILSAAGRLISRNKKRFGKRLHAVTGRGGPVTLDFFDNPRKECIHLAQSLRKEHDAGTPYEEMAVLVRTNAGCREAIEQLMAYEVPFQAADVIPCIFDHWIAKDIFAYMNLGAGSRRRSDFLRIYNRPNRYLKRAAFDHPEISFDQLYQFYEEQNWMLDRLEKMEADIRAVGRLAPYGAVSYIRKEIGYEDYLKEYASSHGISPEELTQVLDELTESARNYKTYREWQTAIEEYRVKLEERRNQAAQKKEGVVISTLHASKGMEYDTVYILDVNEGIIPYHKAVLPEDLEEERRMFYVGMTRARRHLHLCAVREQYDKKMKPSRFLSDMGAPLRV